MNFTKDELSLVYQYGTPSKEETLSELNIILPHIKHLPMKKIIESTTEKLSNLSDEQFTVLVCNTKAFFTFERDQKITDRTLRMRGKTVKNVVGHDIKDLLRFDEAIRHMVIIDVINCCVAGNPGERIRMFLTPDGYTNILKSQTNKEVKILTHARVVQGNLIYDTPAMER